MYFLELLIVGVLPIWILGTKLCAFGIVNSGCCSVFYSKNEVVCFLALLVMGVFLFLILRRKEVVCFFWRC